MSKFGLHQLAILLKNSVCLARTLLAFVMLSMYQGRLLDIGRRKQ
ncbi:hypothetical protein SAMN05444273_1151 [Litoreibacter ascidiaceicola]|uniref:Uncharacterized protein n=1 Tax=Litoreibacter ascidiaceicola TaxID=1486859 RepID=A0A1M5EUR4_9RHOB|nr:hypothetical protein SAMN05444273_1151 [Litoreibacter ascidiaceicola]